MNDMKPADTPAVGSGDMKDDMLISPSDIGDYEIPGWNTFQQWIAGIAIVFGGVGFGILVWTLTR
jgi:hypothetical protein